MYKFTDSHAYGQARAHDLNASKTICTKKLPIFEKAKRKHPVPGCAQTRRFFRHPGRAESLLAMEAVTIARSRPEESLHFPASSNLTADRPDNRPHCGWRA